MRIYAPQVADATRLRDRLDDLGFETRLMTDQVDRILKLETGLRQVFRIVLILSATAFVITAFLLQWMSVVRKKRDFALMSVLGLTSRHLTAFPVFQGALLTTIAGLLSLTLAVAMQGPVETIVQGYLTTPSPVQAPTVLPLLAGILVAIATGALAGVAAIRTLRPEDMTHALRGD
jgi:ABC-type lipoprotein release transport system permease subunit